MSVLLKEMRQDHPTRCCRTTCVLQDQVKLCKETLQQLVRAAEANRRLAVEMQDVTLARRSAEPLAPDAPGSQLPFPAPGSGHVPRMAPPPDLTQACSIC
jgi:two-component system sensor histidine kinase RegB